MGGLPLLFLPLGLKIENVKPRDFNQHAIAGQRFLNFTRFHPGVFAKPRAGGGGQTAREFLLALIELANLCLVFGSFIRFWRRQTELSEIRPDRFQFFRDVGGFRQMVIACQPRTFGQRFLNDRFAVEDPAGGQFCGRSIFAAKHSQ